MFQDIWEKVTDCKNTTQPAYLCGYRRKTVIEQYFPAIIKSESNAGKTHKNQVIKGVTYLGVDSIAMQKLDEYEGELYTREVVQVLFSHPNDNAKCVSPSESRINAYTYVLKEDFRQQLSDQDWSPEYFKKNWFNQYMQNFDNDWRQ